MPALGVLIGAGVEGAEGAESQIAEVTEGQRRAEAVTCHPQCHGRLTLQILHCGPDGDVDVT